MESKYKHEYDDPYRFLASGIAVRYNIERVKRMLSDKDYIRQIVQEEVRDNIDIPGMFADCIVTELISEKQKVLYRNALNELGLFFYQQLDIPRLRREIVQFYTDFGIELTPNKK
jgi:hypothetical protein